jgi:NadR type nicotinamide-nucleotide adenylyltransferase
MEGVVSKSGEGRFWFLVSCSWFLVSAVSTDRILKVAVLGAESTGKSWLCENLAARFHTAWVQEYAREYFHDSDIYNYTLRDLEIIAAKQLSLEDESEKKANGILFCDTTLITLKIWAELEFGECPPSVTAKMDKERYALYLITENDVAWETDPLRQNKHSRSLLKEMNMREVISTGMPYVIVAGQEEKRLHAAIAAVDRILR